MYDELKIVIISTLKQIKPDATVYMDSVMQSSKDFYFILSIENGGAENVGITIQNKAFLIDIAMVSKTENKDLHQNLLSLCESLFNVLILSGETIFPENYTDYETDGVPHVSFTVAFPQQIEWSEE